MNELDRYAVSLENMEVLRAQVEALEAWKAEELALMNPLMGYALSVCTGPLGCSITGWLVEDHKRLAALSANHSEQFGQAAKFTLGDLVRKTKGSQWQGTVVGTYSTALTPEGYAVESGTELGSVQIYPAAALEACE